MIGRCSVCSAYGEVDLTIVPNGGQRILCPNCANGSGPETLPDPKRFRILLGRMKAGSLVPGEARDLRFALETIANTADADDGVASRRRVEVARTLLAGLDRS